MSYPVLPYDILIDIIDIIAETGPLDLSMQTLKAISSLSKFCNHHCRKHIFKSIDAGYAKEKEFMYYETAYTLKLVITPIQPRVASFIKLVKEHPGVIPYIQRFCLVHFDYPYGVEENALSSALPKLSNLSSLEIRLNNNAWTGYLSRTVQSLCTLPNLTHLRLDNIFNFPIGAFTSFPHLKALELLSFDLKADELAPRISTPPLKITTLLIDDVNRIDFLARQRVDGKNVLDLTELKNLSFAVNSHLKIQDMSFLLRNQMSQVQGVEEMKITITVYDPASTSSLSGFEFDIKPHFDLWILPNRRALKRLHLTSLITQTMGDPYSGICQTLEKLETDNILEELTITVNVAAPPIGQVRIRRTGTKWKALFDILMKPGWEKLKVLSLVVKLNGTDRDVSQLGDFIDSTCTHAGRRIYGEWLIYH
ncbi:hypothetical protein CVT24_004593 [Panaeolus cyanescens]|uniref:F-box domain-containing protein n=1 Tax=Panaeolus cyanescens TaxID=181874 RepID=A0A409YBD5_9AGAR|nr:hypothetical protein CVT24_004593 [Panaeolus cyanescens]